MLSEIKKYIKNHSEKTFFELKAESEIIYSYVSYCRKNHDNNLNLSKWIGIEVDNGRDFGKKRADEILDEMSSQIGIESVFEDLEYFKGMKK